MPTADGRIKGIAVGDLPLGIRSERLERAVEEALTLLQAYGSLELELAVSTLDRALREYRR